MRQYMQVECSIAQRTIVVVEEAQNLLCTYLKQQQAEVHTAL